MLVYLRSIFYIGEQAADDQFLRPQLSGCAATCRLSIGVACVLFFTGWFGNIEKWIGSDGPLPTELTRFFIGQGVEGSGAMFRLSPYYSSPEASTWMMVHMLAGVFASLALISGFGGRWTVLILWGLMLTLLHRVSMLQSQGELLLCSIIPYLFIDTGWLTEPTRVGYADNQLRWSSAAMTGVLRWHLMFWLIATLASHLSQTIWWDGSALWSIAVNEQSPIFSADFVASNSWISPLGSNAWLLLHVAFVATLAIRVLRPLAILIGAVYWLGAIALTGDWMLGLVGMAATSCVFYEATITMKQLAFAATARARRVA